MFQILSWPDFGPFSRCDQVFGEISVTGSATLKPLIVNTVKVRNMEGEPTFSCISFCLFTLPFKFKLSNQYNNLNFFKIITKFS